MTPFLIDTHAHLHFPPYDQDREEVLQHLRQKRIWAITIGTSLENSRRGIAWAETQEGIWATAGLHPEHVTSTFQDEQEGAIHEQEIDEQALQALAGSSKTCVAIGECGLDAYRIDEGMDRSLAQQRQETEFKKHLHVAKKLDLPLVIHCRDALTRLAEILQESWTQGYIPKGVVHSFTGTWQEAKPLIDLGMHIAVNGIATFPPRKNQDPETMINRTIERIPLEKLLLETDAPYLAPLPFRGKRNEPAWVEEVAKHVAAVRGQALEGIASKTTENAIELFRLS